jgi:SpoIID/LytB domain protein
VAVRALAGALTTLVAAAGLLGPAPVARAATVETVEVTGRGWGHGRGMGQYGALGYAVDHGWDHRRILDHFYGGTTRGTEPDATIGVHLTRFDNRDLVVRSASAFSVGTNAVPAGQAARVHRLADGRWRIQQGPGCSGPWTTVQDGIDATNRPEARTGYTGNDRAHMLNLCDGTTLLPFRGALSIRRDNGTTRIGNLIRMEQYLRGVVPRESPASWAGVGNGRGAEQLRAQSVAARSYAWGENRSPFKTCDTISCQVYGGAASEDPRTDAAITATAGEVRRRANGSIARTEFSSSTGGHTAGGEYPAVVDLGDATTANPNRSWKTTLTGAQVAGAYGVGQLTAVTVSKRNGLGADGGRVLEVTVRGTTKTVTVTGSAFRSKFGLKSDWFSLRGTSPSAPPATAPPTTAPPAKIGPYTDIAGSTHVDAILAITRRGIASGCRTDRFCPDVDITRAQLATLLVRALQLPPAPGVDAFDDDDGSTHEDAINRAAAAGIVTGTGHRRFRPDAPVSRDQMATFLQRAFVLPASTTSTFSDVAAGSTHAGAVRAVAAAGITAGCSPTRYCPTRPVTRAQMASFLDRALTGR